MNKTVEKQYRSSSLDKPAHSRRPTPAEIDQDKIYQQTKDEILFWSKKLRVSPSQLFTLPEDHLDELLAAAYDETIRNDMRHEQYKRMEDIKRLEELQQLEEMQRQEEIQKYEHMKRLEEIQAQEEMQLQQKVIRDDYNNRQDVYQRTEDLDPYAHVKRMEEFQRQEELQRQKEMQRQEELARQKEIQRLEKIQIQQVLQQKQHRREQRLDRLKKLSQIKSQFIEQQSSRLRGGSSQLNGRTAWEILHDAALEIEASYGPIDQIRMVGGVDLSLPAIVSNKSYEYVENLSPSPSPPPSPSPSPQKKSFEEPTFHIHNAKFDITLPKT